MMIGDTLVTVCPWWDGDVGKAAVDAQLADDARRRPAHWIWVYHWPPTGSPTSWTGKRHYGDDDLVDWVRRHQPDVVLTGHVHQSPFKPDGGWADRLGETWIFNAGRQIGPVPTRVEIDLTGGSAEWISMLGVETQDLAARSPAARSVL
jgi:Icc-related predicted phosphoesterase